MNCSHSAGIIVEFNPLHNGHLTHIKETRKLTGCKYIVAVMSGNFVQRGEPAICNKWLRTKMALLHGVDIVIEIPVQYVISGADYFARGSVTLLKATGVVDTLCFGSESGNLQEIVSAGHILACEPDLYKTELRMALDRGLSFAAARGLALEKAFANKPSDGLLTKPNNGLGIEYCKALKLLDSSMEVLTTHRVMGGPSATKIRKNLFENVMQDMPMNVVEILQSVNKFVKLDDYSDAFRYLLYRGSDLLDSLGEGLGNRFRRMCCDHLQISDLLAAVKTKRYTYTRLQRTAIQILLDISAKDMDLYEKHGGVQYLRVLGFRKEAAELVGEITRKASLPVITNGVAIDRLLQDDSVAAKMLQQEFIAGDIYRLIANGSSERTYGIVVV